MLDVDILKAPPLPVSKPPAGNAAAWVKFKEVEGIPKITCSDNVKSVIKEGIGSYIVKWCPRRTGSDAGIKAAIEAWREGNPSIVKCWRAKK